MRERARTGSLSLPASARLQSQSRVAMVPETLARGEWYRNTLVIGTRTSADLRKPNRFRVSTPPWRSLDEDAAEETTPGENLPRIEDGGELRYCPLTLAFSPRGDPPSVASFVLWSPLVVAPGAVEVRARSSRVRANVATTFNPRDRSCSACYKSDQSGPYNTAYPH